MGIRVVITNRVAAIFTDAWMLHTDALKQLEQGDIRDAAEKAWCATKRSTDALILARTGEEPEKSPMTSKELRELATEDRGVDSLVSRYYSRMGALHGECFYLGLCEPIDDTERRIRETAIYIRDAEALAQS